MWPSSSRIAGAIVENGYFKVLLNSVKSLTLSAILYDPSTMTIAIPLPEVQVLAMEISFLSVEFQF